MFHYLRYLSPLRLRRRGVPARLGSLVLLLQRSPLVKLLPEARVISTSGFSDTLTFAATVIGGLGAFNTVSRATSIIQTAPAQGGSPIVNLTGGTFSTFNWQVIGFPGALTASTWTISGNLPAGMVPADLRLTHSNFMSGVPIEVGSFPISITVWEDPDATTNQRSVSGDFVINVAAPPAPAITAQPQGGNFTEGAFVSLAATQTSGFTFAWAKNGEPIIPENTTIVGSTAARRYRVNTSDPGPTWRSGGTFNDTAWTAVSGGIGYDRNPNPVNYVPHIAAGGNVESLMFNTGRTAVHIRIPFTVTGNTPVTSLKLRVQCEDGFVAWLNGTEVASQNRYANLPWNSASANDIPDAQAVQFREIDISRNITVLRTGENLLAIQAMNVDTGSSDLLFNCELVGGTDSPHTRRLIIPAVQAADAGSYTLTITNPAGSVTSEPAIIVLPPSIESHPQPVSIASGASTTLTVEAVTSPPWTYQWFIGERGDTSQPVPGATGASFVTPALTQTTKYWVRVTNSAGTADSNAATVTVANVPPSISAQPGSVTIDSGKTADLNVTATGTAPFTYQWYLGAAGDAANPVNGATGASFTTPALTATTSYWVRVTNIVSSADSNTAVVTVNAATPDTYTTWRAAQFSPEDAADPAVSGATADPDGDGVSNEQEYVFGTVPLIAQPATLPSITTMGNQVEVTFTAFRASGPGYEGRTRHYAIETTADVSAGNWTAVPLVSDVTGNDQPVVCIMPLGSGRTFCRLKIWLTP